MTVIQLIRELSCCDPNKEVRVFITNTECDYELIERNAVDYVEMRVKL